MDSVTKLFRGLRRGAIADSGLVVGARVAGAALQALVFAMLAKLYPITVVGIYAAFNSAWALARHVGPLGLDQAALRFIPGFLEEGNRERLRAFEVHSRKVVVAATTAVSVIAIATLGPLAVSGRISVTFLSVLILALGIPLFGLHGVYSNQLRGRGSVLGAQVPESIVLPALGGSLILAGKIFGYTGQAWAVGTTVISAIATLVLYMVLDRPSADWNRSVQSFRRERRAAFEIWAGQLSVGLSVKLPTILAAATLGSAAAAQLEVAFRIQTVLVLIPTAISSVASPMFARAHHRGDLERLRDLLLGFSWLAFVPCAVIAFGLSLVGTRVLGLFGASYEEGYWVLVVLLVAAAIDAAITLASNVYYMTGGHRVVLVGNGIQLVAVLLPFAFVGRGLGLEAIAAGVLIGWLVRDGFLTLCLPRRLGIPAGLLSAAELRRSVFLGRTLIRPVHL